MTKLQRLRDNIEAIRHALTGGGEYDKDVLVKYSGFGGLGFVLNPLDRAAWSKSDMDCYEDTARLHDLQIVEYSDKALAIIGDTQKVKEQLKKLGGRFNAKLKCGAGWIFSKKRENELRAVLAIS